MFMSDFLRIWLCIILHQLQNKISVSHYGISQKNACQKLKIVIIEIINKNIHIFFSIVVPFSYIMQYSAVDFVHRQPHLLAVSLTKTRMLTNQLIYVIFQTLCV